MKPVSHGLRRSTLSALVIVIGAANWEEETFVSRDATSVTANGIDNYSPFALFDGDPTSVGLASNDATSSLSPIVLILVAFAALCTLTGW